MDVLRVTVYVILAMTICVLGVQCHGRLVKPPGRSTLWRYGFDTTRNYQDNELFCGGFQNQWKNNAGKCGLCGDPYQGPRENEAGGKYAVDEIAATYTSGSIITLEVEITANHLGWIEFKICKNDDWTKNFTQACLDENVLQLADGNGSRFDISTTVGVIPVTVTLPDGLVCSQCVIQWRYHAGNSWGQDKDTGDGCVGCGEQEEFYACADVSINSSGSTTGTTEIVSTAATEATEAPATTKEEPTIAPPITSCPELTTTGDDSTDWSKCIATGAWTGREQETEWCKINCPLGNCPPSMCSCE